MPCGIRVHALTPRLHERVSKRENKAAIGGKKTKQKPLRVDRSRNVRFIDIVDVRVLCVMRACALSAIVINLTFY